MKLTGRQRDFLKRILEFYEEIGRPFHYSEIAERFGVSALAAYDMLKVLEGKGLVSSEYVMRGGRGPGRTSLLFFPSPRAFELFEERGGRWEEVRRRILERIKAGEEGILRELASELSEVRDPLAFCAQALAIFALALKRAGRLGLLKGIARMPFGALSLGMMGGVMLGILLSERSFRELLHPEEIAERFRISLEALSPDGLRKLRDFAAELLSGLEA